MNEIKLLDFFLLPKSFYQKIKNRMATLYIGILLVGINDFVGFLIKISIDYPEKFSIEKNNSNLTTYIIAAAAFIILIGALDVLCFSIPMADLFKTLNKQLRLSGEAALVRLMKVYVVTNVFVLFINIVLLLAGGTGTEGAAYNMYALSLILPVIEVWVYAIIIRGAGVIYDFQANHKVIAFIAVYIWSNLLGYALAYIYDKVAFVLLK